MRAHIYLSAHIYCAGATLIISPSSNRRVSDWCTDGLTKLLDWMTEWLPDGLTDWLTGELRNRLITACFTLVFHSCRRHWRLFNLNCRLPVGGLNDYGRAQSQSQSCHQVPWNLYAIVICTLRHGLIERTHPQKKFNEPSVIDWSGEWELRGRGDLACQWAIKSLTYPRWVRIPSSSDQLTDSHWMDFNDPIAWLTSSVRGPILWGIYVCRTTSLFVR